jgi:hypothetical protein
MAVALLLLAAVVVGWRLRARARTHTPGAS